MDDSTRDRVLLAARELRETAYRLRSNLADRLRDLVHEKFPRTDWWSDEPTEAKILRQLTSEVERGAWSGERATERVEEVLSHTQQMEGAMDPSSPLRELGIWGEATNDQAVRDWLDALDPEERNALVLRSLGLHPSDIAAILRKGDTHISHVLRRAVQSLTSYHEDAEREARPQVLELVFDKGVEPKVIGEAVHLLSRFSMDVTGSPLEVTRVEQVSASAV